jgi:predicted enzyme related to lactoylglutathione lyase
MCEADRRMVGGVGWIDLTVDGADRLRDFYADVVGWRATSFDMGDYEDYVMSSPENGMAMAGICHARGENLGIPPQWLMYITVADVLESAQKVVEMGGEIVLSVREMGDTGRFCIIKDPAGAVCALFEWYEPVHHHHHHECDCGHDHDHHDHDHDHDHHGHHHHHPHRDDD